MSTLLETKDNSFPIFMVAFVVIIGLAAYGLSTGKFRSANQNECEQYRDWPMSHVPARCVREFQR